MAACKQEELCLISWDAVYAARQMLTSGMPEQGRSPRGGWGCRRAEHCPRCLGRWGPAQTRVSADLELSDSHISIQPRVAVPLRWRR